MENPDPTNHLYGPRNGSQLYCINLLCGVIVVPTIPGTSWGVSWTGAGDYWNDGLEAYRAADGDSFDASLCLCQ